MQKGKFTTMGTLAELHDCPEQWELNASPWDYKMMGPPRVSDEPNLNLRYIDLDGESIDRWTQFMRKLYEAGL